MFRKLFIAAALATTALSSAHAAEIKNFGDGIVAIGGEIERGDAETFAQTADNETTTVLLASPGGSLIDALRIGMVIRAAHIKTVAIDKCYSACAYIWLAGYRKAIDEDGRLGFHAASTASGEITAQGNALAGKYMSDLGCSYKFIAAALSGEMRLTVFGAEDLDIIADAFEIYAFPASTPDEIRYFLAMN